MPIKWWAKNSHWGVVLNYIKKIISFLFETKESREFSRGMGRVDVFGDESYFEKKSDRLSSFRGLNLSSCDHHMDNESLRLHRGPLYFDDDDLN